MNILSFVILCCAILYCSNVNAKHDALVYSEELEQIDEVKRRDIRKNCLSCFTACPASTKPEEEGFNYSYSLTSSSLFLQHAYDYVQKGTDMHIDICEDLIVPGMVYDDKENSYKTGYELYIDNEESSLFSENYTSLRKIFKNKVIFEPPFDDDGYVERKEATFKIFTESDEEPPLEWNFFWIPVLSIQFFQHQVHIRFHSDVVNKYKFQKVGKCERYILREDRTKDEMKREVENLINNSIPLKFKKESSELTCEQTERCLELTQIMPMGYLHTMAARQATCAHKNLALVWESIAEGQLEKVDRYLYTILRLWYSSINIIFGVNGELEVLEKEASVRASGEENQGENHGEENSSGQKPGEENQGQKSGEENPEQKPGEENYRPVPIPKLLYRIVEYMFKDELYQAMIVIHNSLDQIPDTDRVCPEDSELDSWIGIKNKDLKTGLSYACSVNEETVEKLGKYGGTPGTPSSKTFSLNLNEFPQVKRGFHGSKIIIRDETKAIDEEYKKIFADML